MSSKDLKENKVFFIDSYLWSRFVDRLDFSRCYKINFGKSKEDIYCLWLVRIFLILINKVSITDRVEGVLVFIRFMVDVLVSCRFYY